MLWCERWGDAVAFTCAANPQTERLLRCIVNAEMSPLQFKPTKNVLFAGLRWPNTLAWDAITAGTQIKRCVGGFVLFLGGDSPRSFIIWEQTTVWACNVAVPHIHCYFILIDLHIDKKDLACSEHRKHQAVPFWASSSCGFEDGTCVNWMKWRWMIYCELNPLLYKDGHKSDGPDLSFSCRAHTHTHTHTHAAPRRFHWTAVSWKGCAETLQCTSLNMGTANLFRVYTVCVFGCTKVAQISKNDLI